MKVTKITMKSFYRCAVAAAAVAAAALAGAAQAQSVAIRNANILSVRADGTLTSIERADILIEGATISAIGSGLTPPAGARVIDAAGKFVTAGIFAPVSSIGLSEISLDDEANDSSPRGDFPLSASLDAADAFNPASTLIAINRAGGVTRALTTPGPGAKMFGGHGAVVDLSGAPASITRARASQSVVLDAGGASRSGDTRLGAWAVLREYLAEAASYAQNPRDYVQRRRDDRFAISDLEALGPVISGQTPLIVSINRASEIRALIRLKERTQLRPIILDGAEAHLVARELAAAGIPVILNPLANLPSNFESLDSRLDAAARLHAAGVRIAFTGTASGSHNLRLLTQHAGNAVAAGLPREAAIAALTVNPAAMFGLDARFGSLEPGKVADIVVWDGDPLEAASRPTNVLINGSETSLANRQTQLRDRYRDLSRGALPHAYRGGQP